MPLARGAQLGPYQILAPIGEGGMGEVYKATDTRLDRVVALKISKEQFTERFDREARAVAQLNHPHICQLYDVGPNYLVMEFVEGAPLQGPLPMAKALFYAAEILEALDAAHQKRIIHRDLKPDNILLTKQGIKLLDFGLAQQSQLLEDAHATVVAGLSRKGEIAGTLHYMSPEQLQGREVDARSDLFSFGCVLYELLSGRRAFDADSPAGLIANVLGREPEPLDLPAALQSILQRALAKDPADRWQSASDLRAALQLSVPPAAVTAPQPASGNVSKLWPAAAAAAVVLAAAGWFLALRPKPETPAPLTRFEIPVPEPGASIRSLQLSPDESKLAFVTTLGATDRLWIHSFDSGQSHRLTSVDFARYPFWSPDGKQLAYFAHDKLLKVDIAGGAPQLICNTQVGWGGTWHSSGVIVFSPRPGSPLHRVSANGGVPVRIGESDRPEAFPQFIPGSDRYVYNMTTAENRGAYVASLANPVGKRIANTNGLVRYQSPGVLLHETNSALMALRMDANFAPLGDPVRIDDAVGQLLQYRFLTAGPRVVAHVRAGASSLRRLVWMDRTGKELGVLGETARYSRVALSPDGSRAAVLISASDQRNIWIIDVQRQTRTRFTFSNTFENLPQWSPDGKFLAYYTTESGGAVVRKAADGARDPELLLKQPEDGGVSDWSMDNLFLLLTRKQSQWVLPLEGARKPFPLSANTHWETGGRLSPAINGDVPYIAYESNENGRFDVFVRRFTGQEGGPVGAKWQISTAGGEAPRWSRNGRELFFFDPRGNLNVVEVHAGETFTFGQPKVLPIRSDTRGGGVTSDYDISPDGQRILLNRYIDDDKISPITVTLNWQSMLPNF